MKKPLAVETMRMAKIICGPVVEEESSIPDSMVYQRAIEHQAFLLTADKDFGDIIFRHLPPVPRWSETDLVSSLSPLS